MKRMLSLLLMLVMLCACLPLAQASSVFSREDWYAMGLSALEEMSADSVRLAVDYFDNAGTYEQAKRYEQYAQCLGDIFSLDSETAPDLSMTKYRLQDLAQLSDFSDSLTGNGFPTCPDLLAYISARELEQNGCYAEARRDYQQISNVLDATERRYDLTARAYDEGKALFEAEDYAGAAAALEGLNWADSEELYSQAASIADPEHAAAGIPVPEAGDIVTLGYYEQDGRFENGIEPIEWLVLEVDTANRRALVVSRDGLDSWPYHDTAEAATWESSSLRAWLNNDFFETAFSVREQALILSEAGDRVFLLSADEAMRCFNTDGDRKVIPTAFAVAVGAQTENALQAEGKDSGWWWLRSTGSAADRASLVRFGGSLDEAELSREGGTVRPAFWIALKDDPATEWTEPDAQTPEATPVPEVDLSLTLIVVPSVGRHALSWNAISSAERYEVSRHKTNTAYAGLAETTDTHYDDADVRAGYRYYYTVTAYLPDGRTVVSNEVILISPRQSDPRPTVTPGPTPAPEEETFVLAVADYPGIHLTSIHLSWETVENAVSYEILRHSADETEYNTLVEVDRIVHDYTDADARTGLRYYYQVAAHRRGGAVVLSNEIAVILPPLPIIFYRAVQNDVQITLSVSRAAGKHTLQWNEVPGADHYEIWRHMTKDAYSKPLVESLDRTSYMDQNILPGYRYYYTVKAVFPNGMSAASNEVAVVALQNEKPKGTSVMVYYVNNQDKVLGSRSVTCKVGENFITAPSTYNGLKLIDKGTVCVVLYENGTLSPKAVYFHYQ